MFAPDNWDMLCVCVAVTLLSVSWLANVAGSNACGTVLIGRVVTAFRDRA